MVGTDADLEWCLMNIEPWVSCWSNAFVCNGPILKLAEECSSTASLRIHLKFNLSDTKHAASKTSHTKHMVKANLLNERGCRFLSSTLKFRPCSTSCDLRKFHR